LHLVLDWHYITINVGAGVVDEDYHGNLSMIPVDHSDKPFYVSPGDRIAEPICQNI
jgi:dUTP pyrophosphatase